MTTKKIGDVILDIKNISLRFGGVKALTDISFNVREHEIRSIIGPNGAGKSSMLNCINGVYTPSEGSITFRGQTFDHMNSRQVAEMGVARTFQNLALFKGMSVIDNIMTGRNLKIKSNLLMQALRIGPAQREEMAQREFVEHIIDFLEIQAYRKTPVGQLPYGLQKRVDLGRALAMEPQELYEEQLILSRQLLRDHVFAHWLGKDPEELDIRATYNLVYNAAFLVEQRLGLLLSFKGLVPIEGPEHPDLTFRPFSPAFSSHNYLIWKKEQVFSRAAAIVRARLEEAFGHMTDG